MTQAVVPEIGDAPVLASFADALLALGPTGYWPLDETSGTNANDLGSGNHDGTYTNTPTLDQVGPLVGAAVNRAVLFPTAAPVKYVAVAWTTVPATPTLGAWVKGTHLFDDNGLAGWRDAGAVANCYIYLSSIATAVRFIIGNATNDVVYDSSGVLNDNRWHLIIGTYDGTNARLYYDSVLVAGPITKTAAGGTSSTAFKIAQYGAPSGTSFNGTIAHPFVFDVALSAAQISALWNASAPGQR